jgi:hypothetical protein
MLITGSRQGLELDAVLDPVLIDVLDGQLEGIADAVGTE